MLDQLGEKTTYNLLIKVSVSAAFKDDYFASGSVCR